MREKIVMFSHIAFVVIVVNILQYTSKDRDKWLSSVRACKIIIIWKEFSPRPLFSRNAFKIFFALIVIYVSKSVLYIVYFTNMLPIKIEELHIKCVTLCIEYLINRMCKNLKLYPLVVVICVTIKSDKNRLYWQSLSEIPSRSSLHSLLFTFQVLFYI